MAKKVYSDEERAAIFLSLKVAEGNVARASRETSVPQQTVRDMKRRWESGEWDPPDRDLLDAVADSYILKIERVRDKALNLLEERVGDTKNPKDIATIFGILDDKIRLARGLATSRSETVYKLPEPEEMAEVMAGMVQGALEAQRKRVIEIDSVVEQAPKALNAGD